MLWRQQSLSLRAKQQRAAYSNYNLEGKHYVATPETSYLRLLSSAERKWWRALSEKEDATFIAQPCERCRAHILYQTKSSVYYAAQK